MHTETEPVRAAPSPAERIRALVPDHTAIVLRPDGGSWTWSTPAGLWAIYGDLGVTAEGAPRVLTLSGPGGTWQFPGADEDLAVRQLEGVLRALDAIPAASAAH